MLRIPLFCLLSIALLAGCNNESQVQSSNPDIAISKSVDLQVEELTPVSLELDDAQATDIKWQQTQGQKVHFVEKRSRLMFLAPSTNVPLGFSATSKNSNGRVEKQVFNVKVSATISGFVVDDPIVGATVRLLSANGDEEFANTKTDNQGKYQFTNSLELDTYRVKIDALSGSFSDGRVFQANMTAVCDNLTERHRCHVTPLSTLIVKYIDSSDGVLSKADAVSKIETALQISLKDDPFIDSVPNTNFQNKFNTRNARAYIGDGENLEPWLDTLFQYVQNYSADPSIQPVLTYPINEWIEPSQDYTGPTVTPTAIPTAVPTVLPTSVPSVVPTTAPTPVPPVVPTVVPTPVPTVIPTPVPTVVPTPIPTEPPILPTTAPTLEPTIAPTGAPDFKYTKNVLDYGFISDDLTDDSGAMIRLLESAETNDIIYFPSGEYHFESEIIFPDNFPKNVTFVGTDSTFVTKLISPNKGKFSGNALWNLEAIEQFTIDNINFKGIYTTNSEIIDKNDGLLISSSNGTIIKNSSFHGFGDACIRVTSSTNLPPPGRASINTRIDSNNFSECVGVSTANYLKGYTSTDSISITNNNFYDVIYGLKLVSDEPSTDVTVLSNKFIDSKSDAILFNTYRSITVKNNGFSGIRGFSVNVTPAKYFDEKVIDSIFIVNNFIKNSRYGIRLKPFDQNLVNNPINVPVGEVNIRDNYFEGIYHDTLMGGNNTPKYYQVIRLNPYTEGMIDNFVLENNRYFDISEPDGGELYNEEFLRLTTLNQFIKGNINIKTAPFLFKGDELNNNYQPPLPVVTKVVNWDHFFPSQHEYEVAYPDNIGYSIEKITAPSYVRRGLAAAKFKLNSISDPLVHGSHRAEIVGDLISEEYAERWFSFSTMLSGDYDYSKGAESIFQVHTSPSDGNWERDISTPYALITAEGKYRFKVAGSDKVPIPLVKKTLFIISDYERLVWVDWVFNVYHHPVNGFVKIWQNGNLVVNYSGPVGYSVDSYNHNTYPKWGLYRWDWELNPEIKSRTLFIDEIKVGGKEASYEIMTSSFNN
ncbi:heparin lyase I family protein [Motilimonas sp. 1_MG-2023]|uniref:heparin lyase I family protein n=1 Tax=Motilimonas sp. 1_MG-2023 TaxID=3062672 RepID=UPI0026E2F89A|nr:heparin lyase I family protein [Motilimonas sp. 1_MG-2023]MDO6526636.1 heparin lyase I family protein [Motilimonas sp. 1_MG-2023]